jgi:hypothetical protein
LLVEDFLQKINPPRRGRRRSVIAPAGFGDEIVLLTVASFAGA